MKGPPLLNALQPPVLRDYSLEHASLTYAISWQYLLYSNFRLPTNGWAWKIKTKMGLISPLARRPKGIGWIWKFPVCATEALTDWSIHPGKSIANSPLLDGWRSPYLLGVRTDWLTEIIRHTASPPFCYMDGFLFHWWPIKTRSVCALSVPYLFPPLSPAFCLVPYLPIRFVRPFRFPHLIPLSIQWIRYLKCHYLF